ncbi:MAG: hypothetical protein JNM96_00740 [Bacteroidia bacterium]|nr:hypothetical protein [Bacteroidia bacterium]
MEQTTSNTPNSNANSTPGKGLGLSGLIVGIVAVLFSFIPCLGMYAIIPAVVGIILSAISMSQAGKAGAPKGMAIGGLICSVVAVLIALYWVYVTMFVANEATNVLMNELENTGALDSLNKALDQIKEITDTMQTH